MTTTTLQLPKIDPPPDIEAPIPATEWTDTDIESIENEEYDPAAIAAELGIDTAATTAPRRIKLRVAGPSAGISHTLLAVAAAVAVVASAHSVTDFIDHGPVMPAGRTTPPPAAAAECVMFCNQPPLPECVIGAGCAAEPTGAAAMVATLFRLAE